MKNYRAGITKISSDLHLQKQHLYTVNFEIRFHPINDCKLEDIHFAYNELVKDIDELIKSSRNRKIDTV